VGAVVVVEVVTEVVVVSVLVEVTTETVETTVAAETVEVEVRVRVAEIEIVGVAATTRVVANNKRVEGLTAPELDEEEEKWELKQDRWRKYSFLLIHGVGGGLMTSGVGE